jgi:hypothetical protein
MARLAVLLMMHRSACGILLIWAGSSWEGLVVVAFAPRIPVGSLGTKIPTHAAVSLPIGVDDELSLVTRMTLPQLFPALATSLQSLGFATPTPIQNVSATMAATRENLLLVAPTGSGKTLAFLLPALSKALGETTSGTTTSTVLVVAPTRELAVQLQRDTIQLLAANRATTSCLETAESGAVALAVRGVPPPVSLTRVTVLIGTPMELEQTLIAVGRSFMANLRSVVLDEVDVLLPLAAKTFRTSLDMTTKEDSKKGSPGEQERRRQQEDRQRQAHQRKLKAAKQAGTQLLSSDNRQVVVAPTDRLLRMIAISAAGGSGSTNGTAMSILQLTAASATASRRTLDRLNRAMRAASAAANSDYALIWGSDVQMCRSGSDTSDDDNDAAEERNSEGGAATHTIRSVTVPSQVAHRYISLSKESALSSDAVLLAVAQAAAILKPASALIFLCGEFAKPNVNQKALLPSAIPTGKTRPSRRNSKFLFEKAASVAKAPSPTDASLLSARKACDILGKLGIEAQVRL